MSTPRTLAAAIGGALLGASLTMAATTATSKDAPRKPAVVSIESAPKRHLKNRARVHMLARGKEAFLGRLELAPGGAVPEHRDPTEEYLYILEGHGTLHINDVQHTVTPHTTIYMPAGAKVRYTNGDRRLVALQVFANPGPEAKYNAWTAGDWAAAPPVKAQ